MYKYGQMDKPDYLDELAKQAYEVFTQLYRGQDKEGAFSAAVSSVMPHVSEQRADCAEIARDIGKDVSRRLNALIQEARGQKAKRKSPPNREAWRLLRPWEAKTKT